MCVDPGHSLGFYKYALETLLDKRILSRPSLAACLELFPREKRCFKCFSKCCFFIHGSLPLTCRTFAVMCDEPPALGAVSYPGSTHDTRIPMEFIPLSGVTRTENFQNLFYRHVECVCGYV